MARGKKAAADAGPADEPWELPEGWRWERVADLVTKSSTKCQPDRKSTLPFVGLEHIPSHEMRLSGVGAFAAMQSSGSAFQPGDVLYSRLRPYLNKVWVADREGACSGELLVLRPHSGVNARYLALQLHGQRYLSYAANVVTGDRPRIDFDLVGAFPVPVPDVSTQNVIVSRIDAMFAEIDEGEAALGEARAGVETYRKSLLKAAVTGELTADWRRHNPPRESGADLLRRILGERRARWQDEPKNAGKRYVEPSGPDADELPALPEGWTWASLHQLTVDGPSNGYSPRASKDGTGTLSLKLTATSSGSFRLDAMAVKRLGETISAASDLFLRSGDLLFQRGNTRDLVGMAAVFDGPEDTFVYPDLMIRVRTLNDELTKWVWRWANSPLGRQYMMDHAQGAAGSMPKISGDTIRRMPVPICDCWEIRQILSLVEDGLSRADSVPDVQVAALRQSILAAAFRGELSV